MGIKGLFSFLKRWEQHRLIEDVVKKKRVGIDFFWFLYQSKGDLTVLQESLSPFLTHSSEVHVVIDGFHTTVERRVVLEERRNKRQGKIEMMEEIMAAPFSVMEEKDRKWLEKYVNQLERQVWKPSRAYIGEIKQWLQEKGVSIHEPDGEADDALIDLEKKKIVDLVITNDSDLVVLGADTIVRMYSIHDKKGCVMSKSHLRKQLGFTIQQWDDFMHLCKYMNDTDVLLAYSLIRVYKDVDHVVTKWNAVHHEPLLREAL
jgi:XPG I-region